MSDDLRGLRELKQERHADWREENLAVLRKSLVPFAMRDTACLFRQPGKPWVDFYPHTGRWRAVGPNLSEELKGRTFSGGAKSFLGWYAKAKL